MLHFEPFSNPRIIITEYSQPHPHSHLFLDTCRRCYPLLPLSFFSLLSSSSTRCLPSPGRGMRIPRTHSTVNRAAPHSLPAFSLPAALPPGALISVAPPPSATANSPSSLPLPLQARCSCDNEHRLIPADPNPAPGGGPPH